MSAGAVGARDGKMAYRAKVREYHRTGAVSLVASVSLSTTAKVPSDQATVEKNHQFMVQHALKLSSVVIDYDQTPDGPEKQSLYRQNMLDNAAATKCEIENCRLGNSSAVTKEFLKSIYPAAKPDIRAEIKRVYVAIRQEVRKNEAIVDEIIKLGTLFIAKVESEDFEEARSIGLQNDLKKRDRLASDLIILEKFLPVMRAHDPESDSTKLFEKMLVIKKDQMEKLVAHLEAFPKEQKSEEKR